MAHALPYLPLHSGACSVLPRELRQLRSLAKSLSNLHPDLPPRCLAAECRDLPGRVKQAALLAGRQRRSEQE